MKTLATPQSSVPFKRNNTCRALVQSLACSRSSSQFSFPFLSHFQLKTSPNQLKFPPNWQILPFTRWLLPSLVAAGTPANLECSWRRRSFTLLSPFSSFTILYTYCYHTVVDLCKTGNKAVQYIFMEEHWNCVSSRERTWYLAGVASYARLVSKVGHKVKSYQVTLP